MGCAESAEMVAPPRAASATELEEKVDDHIAREKVPLAAVVAATTETETKFPQCVSCKKKFSVDELGFVRQMENGTCASMCFFCLQQCGTGSTKCLICGKTAVEDPEYGCMCSSGHVVCQSCYRQDPDRRWCDEFGPNHVVWKRYIGILLSAATAQMSIKINDIPKTE